MQVRRKKKDLKILLRYLRTGKTKNTTGAFHQRSLMKALMKFPPVMYYSAARKGIKIPPSVPIAQSQRGQQQHRADHHTENIHF